jgi:uncharacterized protein YecA (UPF0149 family)
MQEEKFDKIESNEINKENIEDLLNSEEFIRTYAKMHTPWKRRVDKPRRNDICPFCNSGLKFKNCECFEKFKNTPLYTINY